jgi:hypothetical protein
MAENRGGIRRVRCSGARCSTGRVNVHSWDHLHPYVQRVRLQPFCRTHRPSSDCCLKDASTFKSTLMRQTMFPPASMKHRVATSCEHQALLHISSGANSQLLEDRNGQHRPHGSTAADPAQPCDKHAYHPLRGVRTIRRPSWLCSALPIVPQGSRRRPFTVCNEEYPSLLRSSFAPRRPACLILNRDEARSPENESSHWARFRT